MRPTVFFRRYSFMLRLHEHFTISSSLSVTCSSLPLASTPRLQRQVSTGNAAMDRQRQPLPLLHLSASPLDGAHLCDDCVALKVRRSEAESQ